MMDVHARGLTPRTVMFLAGSAINSIKNAKGEYDPVLGAEAMTQALEVHKSGAPCATSESANISTALAAHRSSGGPRCLARIAPPALSGAGGLRGDVALNRGGGIL